MPLIGFVQARTLEVINLGVGAGSVLEVKRKRVGFSVGFGVQLWQLPSSEGGTNITQGIEKRGAKFLPEQPEECH